MRIHYQICSADGINGAGLEYLPEPPKVGDQRRFNNGPLYDVTSVLIEREYNDDEGETTEFAVVQLKLHLPELTGYQSPFKTVGHDGPCHDLKISKVSDQRARDTMTTQVMRQVLELDTEQLTRTLIFLKSL